MEDYSKPILNPGDLKQLAPEIRNDRFKKGKLSYTCGAGSGMPTCAKQESGKIASYLCVQNSSSSVKRQRTSENCPRSKRKTPFLEQKSIDFCDKSDSVVQSDVGSVAPTRFQAEQMNLDNNKHDNQRKVNNNRKLPVLQSNGKERKQEALMDDIIVRRRVFNGKLGDWGQFENLLLESEERNIWEYKFDNGKKGILRVHPNLLSPDRQIQLYDELLSSNEFRMYKFQAVEEPRMHLVLHEDATQDFENENQPGYCYGRSLHMKAHSFLNFPVMTKFSSDMKKLCEVEKWKACVDVVYYRDGKDYIGFHADNSQNETKILAVVVSSPSGARSILVQTKKEKGQKPLDGDEELELFIRAGDGYDMDGLMQKFFVHSVRGKSNLEGNPNGRRLSVIFRDGDLKFVKNDTGTQCSDFSPREKHKCHFGRGLSGLFEGQQYSRHQLWKSGFHPNFQCGVSGNKEEGCPAIIIGTRIDSICSQEQGLASLTYNAELHNGANRILLSALRGLPIRVFRSAKSHGPLKVKPTCESKNLSTLYRYEGLYKVSQTMKHYIKIKENGKLSFYFRLERAEVGPMNDQNQMNVKEFAERFTLNRQSFLDLTKTDHDKSDQDIAELVIGSEKQNTMKVSSLMDNGHFSSSLKDQLFALYAKVAALHGVIINRHSIYGYSVCGSYFPHQPYNQNEHNFLSGSNVSVNNSSRSTAQSIVFVVSYHRDMETGEDSYETLHPCSSLLSMRGARKNKIELEYHLRHLEDIWKSFDCYLTLSKHYNHDRNAEDLYNCKLWCNFLRVIQNSKHRDNDTY